MRRILNKKCVLCGKEYSYCPTCGIDMKKPAWYAIFDDENCKNIFETCSEYGVGDLSKEDAKKRLDACDLSKKESYPNGTKKQIEEIYNNDVQGSNIDIKEINIKEIKDEEVAKEAKSEVVIENKTISKKNFRRSK